MVAAASFEGVSVNLPLDVTEVTENGIIAGDPARSTAEIGAGIVEWLIAFTARFAGHFRQCDPRDIQSAPDTPR